MVFHRRFVSDSELSSETAPEQTADTHYDLITFLAAVQRMQVDILPITYQSARDRVGRGATSRINEALINLETSFAFKCVSKEQKRKFPKAKIIQTLINEIVVLGHPFLREHPNIVELQGICWDVTSLGVWPVLVLEKSHFGDLYSFLHLPVGRDLGTIERLKLCVDIGTAISDMHLNNIIHGDIKPENVLIFKDNVGAYTARVIDFGYSTRFAKEDDFIPMPKSEPWHAPDHHSNCKPIQARKMDVFSFGLLCLWTIFEKYLSSRVPLPQEALWAEQYFHTEYENHLSEGVLANLKREDKLVLLARQLVVAEQGLEDNQRRSLQEFFSTSLVCEPEMREDDLRRGFGGFILDQRQPLEAALEEDRFNVSCYNFEIALSKISFYQSDYRVRLYIRHCLEHRVLDVATSLPIEVDRNLAFELAICYEIGFGGVRSDQNSRERLIESGRTHKDLAEAVDRIYRWDSTENPTETTYKNLARQDYIEPIDLPNQYRKIYKLEEAEAEIKREIGETLRHSGKYNIIATILTGTLLWLMFDQGRWKDAEELGVHVIEAEQRVLGAEHPDTLNSMGNLALIYRNQGRWKEAEELHVQATETCKRVFGAEHLSTLNRISNLASTYRSQGRWKEAEELEVQVIETRRRVLGTEHPDTLAGITNLAFTYRKQGRGKEAEELELQAIETRKRVLGAEHPGTLTSIGNLALAFWSQGRWKEAEELEVQVMETSKRVLGAEHPNTLTSMGNLALMYEEQGQWKEAEELEVQVIETSKRVLGAEHPNTLTSMGNLVSTFWNQGRWKEAEELLMQVMETHKRVLGAEHPDTLASIGNLAMIYSNQDKWKEAEELEVQVIETSKRVLGAEHPNTLTTIANLASTFWGQGKWKEAEELEMQVIETRKKVLGAEHPDTIASMGNLALTYSNQDKLKEAEELQVQVMETRKRVVGTEHPSTLTSMANLALTYRDQGRWKEAEELEAQAIEIHKRVLSAEHPDTLPSMGNSSLT